MTSSKELLAEFARLAAEELKGTKIKNNEETIDEINKPDLISSTANFLSKRKKVEEQNDPLVPLNQDFMTRKEFDEHYKLFISRVQAQLSTIGGGGEVKLRNLDDVDRSTIGPNKHLAYDPTTGKFFFESISGVEPQVQSDWNTTDTEDVSFIKNKPVNLSDFNNDEGFITSPDGGNADQLDGQEGSYYLDYNNFTNTPNTQVLADDGTTTEITGNTVSVINLPDAEIGPIQVLNFDPTHDISTHDHSVGAVCWNEDDQTLNVFHPGDVIQQVGQELYGYVRNNTDSTIANGTAVRFAGAETNGNARLEVAPFEADGTFPSLYGLGIATQSMADGEDGRVTVWGKVRDIDTTGGSENWQLGDILYVSPTAAGALTNIKPTAPNNVVPIAAVLRVDATEGEIFVRPTIEQQQSYGVFTRTTDLSPTNNVATLVGFNTAEISNGVSVVSNTQITVNQSGLYQIEWTLHWDSQSTGFGTDPVYTFLRKNGTDVANTLRRNSVSDFDPAGQTFTATRTLSLDANDYIEVVIVTTGGNVDLVAADAITSPFNAPATAAAEITIAQIQL